ncbi:MAG: Coenzyme A biosynthesis bifunctional protein CoaBC [Cellvibrionales bacterium UBA7375]|nr:bifunctional phosphopantothenoylcysteine decarboxylase/phosphopantothenate--cysteine ligase CoaBC [Gammaproteobacteria bacterium]CAI8167117.1 MAG: Coenzyme A biosynthesis bifunctional protein CoaBC [Cellvibrionales bacterium UBA7375]
MSSLSQKRIILGITGGIAAYKSAEIARRLQDHGAEVRVIMTDSAQEFIRPLTLQALTGKPVHTDLLDTKAEAAMGHIELARWADAILVAPATANFMAALSQGTAHDLLTTVCLASSGKIIVAPAMNQAMWSQPASQQNIESLKRRGITILEPDNGVQACGDIGPGRLQQPDVIVEHMASIFDSGILSGKQVVITAGPTREAIDPVRYISNHSSGKMGYALASAMTDAGASVTLISGPVSLQCPDRCELISVVSADDMLAAASLAVKKADIFISSAAVADYRVTEVASQKIKKKSDKMSLNLSKTPDIVAILSENNPNLFVVGFAAETEQVEAHAREKLDRKQLNAIIANDVSRMDIGFNSDDNEALWIDADNSQTLSKKSKAQLAREIAVLIANKINR